MCASEDFNCRTMSISRSLRIHGTFGEDGQVQKILEDRGVAYTGEGVEGSEIAFDKIRIEGKIPANTV